MPRGNDNECSNCRGRHHADTQPVPRVAGKIRSEHEKRFGGGLTGGLGIDATLKAFNSGLGGGATVALSYALLGAFAVAIAKSGLAHALAVRTIAVGPVRQGMGQSDLAIATAKAPSNA